VKEKIGILIIGAGKSGSELISLFSGIDTVDVAGVADIDQDAPGIKLAKELNIPTTSDYRNFINAKGLSLIFNATGDDKVREDAAKIKAPGVELINSYSAKLIWMVAEERMREAAQKARAIFDQTFQFIGLMTPDGKVVEANRAALEFAGIEESAVLGKPFWETPWWTHSPDMQERLRQAVKRVAGGEFIRFEATHIAKDGGLHYVDFSLKPIKDTSGKVVFMVPEGRDITEKRRAEDALKTEQRKFSDAINALSDSFFVLDLNGKFLMWNKALEEITQHTKEEVAVMDVAEFFEKSEKEKVFKAIAAAIEKGHASLEANVITKSNKLIPHSIMGKILKDAAGNVIGVAGIGRDMSERKRAEEGIRKINRMQASLLDVGSLDEKLKKITDGVVDIFNADFARIWLIDRGDRCDSGCPHAGITEGPHVCRSRDKCLHLVASSGRYTHIDGGHTRVPFGCYKIGGIASGKYPSFLTNDVANDPHVHKHDWAKELGLVSFAGFQLHPPHGEAIGVLALFSKHTISDDEFMLLENISTMAARVIQTGIAEELLRQSKENLVRITNAVPGAVYEFKMTPEGKMEFTFLSRGIKELLGVSSDDILKDFSMAWSHVLPEDVGHLRESILVSAKTQALWQHEFRVRASDDSIKTILGSSAPTRVDSAGNSFWNGTLLDIEDRKKSEDEIREINKELDDFTYIVSHDLKEPLRSIDAFSKFIETDYKDRMDAEGVKYLERIRANCQMMQKLIENLLEISRMERTRNLSEDVNVEEIVDEVKFRLEYITKEKNAEIFIKDKLPRIFCDRVRLTEAFANLILNAIKFNDKKKPIVEIGCDIENNFYKFYVKDNGPGIDKKYFNIIFQIFQRLGRREDSEGTGAGLAIVKKIIRMHKGDIWVESEKKKGSVFYFTIPRDKETVMGRRRIGEILIDKNLVSAEDLKKALDEQVKGGGSDE